MENQIDVSKDNEQAALNATGYGDAKDHVEDSKGLILSEHKIEKLQSIMDVMLAWDYVATIKRRAKELEAMMKKNIINYMQQNNNFDIAFSDTQHLVYKKKVTQRFKTDYIYKAFEFTPEQIEILPANPKFRKTAILANEKTAPAYWEEEEDDMELKEFNKEVIDRNKQRTKIKTEAIKNKNKSNKEKLI